MSCCEAGGAGRNTTPRRARRRRPRDQPIAEPARRLDRDLGHTGLLELLAKTADVHVDEPRVTPRLVAPDAYEKVVTGEDPSRFARERAEQLELGRRERQLTIACDRLQARQVDDEAAEPQLPLLGVDAARAVTAQERLDAGRELIVVEGLAEIVVGPDPEADHAVGRVVFGREKE